MSCLNFTECRDLFLDTTDIINKLDKPIHKDEEWNVPGTDTDTKIEKKSTIELFVTHLITDKEYADDNVILLSC